MLHGHKRLDDSATRLRGGAYTPFLETLNFCVGNPVVAQYISLLKKCANVHERQIRPSPISQDTLALNATVPQ